MRRIEGIRAEDQATGSEVLRKIAPNAKNQPDIEMASFLNGCEERKNLYHFGSLNRSKVDRFN